MFWVISLGRGGGWLAGTDRKTSELRNMVKLSVVGMLRTGHKSRWAHRRLVVNSAVLKRHLGYLGCTGYQHYGAQPADIEIVVRNACLRLHLR